MILAIICLDSASAIDNEDLNNTVDAYDNLKHENIVIEEINKNNVDDVSEANSVGIESEKENENLLKTYNDDVLSADTTGYISIRETNSETDGSFEGVVGEQFGLDVYWRSLQGMQFALLVNNQQVQTFYPSGYGDSWSDTLYYTPESAGTYNVMVICQGSSTRYVSNVLTWEISGSAKTETETSISINPSSVAPNEEFTINYNVYEKGTTNAVNEGTISFYDQNGQIGSAINLANPITFTHSYSNKKSYNIYAVYTATDNYKGSESSKVKLAVKDDSDNVNLKIISVYSSSDNAYLACEDDYAYFGTYANTYSKYDIIVTFAVESTSEFSSGTIQYGTSTLTSNTFSGSNPTLAFNRNNAGENTVSVVVNGVESNTVTIDVKDKSLSQASSISITPTSGNEGQSIILTPTVMSPSSYSTGYQSIALSGIVTIYSSNSYSDADKLGTVSTDGGSFVVPLIDSNSEYEDFTYYATFSGEYGSYCFYTPTSNSFSFRIYNVAVSKDTTVSLSPNDSIIINQGTSQNIVATVTADNQDVTEGNITYYDGDNPISGYTEVSITTAFNTADLSEGTHYIKVKYNGAEGYNPSALSDAVTVTVTVPNTDTISVSVTNTTYGNTVATVTVGQAGTYTLKINDVIYNNEITFAGAGSQDIPITSFAASESVYIATIVDNNNVESINFTTFTISKSTPSLSITVNGNNTLTSDSHSIVVNTLGSGKIKINSDSTLYDIGQTITLNNLVDGINSINVNYTGDENYSSVVKTIIFNTYALYPSSISINLNETGIKKGASIKINTTVTVMGNTINKGNVAFYYKNGTLINTIDLEEKSYLDFAPSDDEGAEITVYAKYLGYNDLGYAESENSNEESFKIKKALVINLTVTGLFDGAARTGSSYNGPFYVFYADTGDYSPILEVYDNYYDNPCLYGSDEGKQGNSEIDSFYFNTGEIGDHEVYVKFLGDDEYLPSESNHILFTVYQSRDIYNGGIEFNPNYGLGGTTVSIIPKVYYGSSSKEYLSNGILKVYSDSSKNNLIANIDISQGDSFDYEVVSTSSYYNYNTIYATFEGVNGDYYYYNQYTLSARFYIMNENSFSLTGNGENGTIEINSGETITLSADIGEYRFDRSSDNSLVCIYVDDVNVVNFTGVYSSSYGSYSVSDYNFDFTGYSAGQHVIYAEYLGYVDTSYNYYYAPVRSNNLTVKILQDTSISLSPSSITVTQGDNEHYISPSVTTSDGAVNGGNITYFDNGVAIEGYTNVAISTKLYLTNLPIGSHTITAQYLGNGAYKSSAVSDGVSVVVQKVDGFSISVTSPDYPTTAIATVTGDGGETYTITIVGTDKSFDVTIASGETQITQDLGVLGVNSTWKAVVSHGDKTNETTFSVNKGTPILIITVNGNETLLGDLHNITVSTQGSGKITLNDESTQYNIGDVIVLNDLTSGSNKITVKYDGDENYTNVEKDIYFTLYDKYSTTITLTLNETSITKGGSILVTPNVKNQKGDDVEGRVTFYFDSENPIETIDLAKTKNITITPSTSGSIYAVFLENDTLTTSTSGTVEFIVNKKTVNTIVTLELNTDELLSSGQIIVTPHVVGVNGEEVDAGSFIIKDVQYLWDSSGQITKNINLGDAATITPPYNGVDPSKNPYTLYVWYNGGTGQEYIFNDSKSDIPTQYYHVYSNSLSLTADGENEVTAHVGDSITLHATLTQGSDVKLFIDGVLKGTISANSDSLYEITSDLIGNHNISVKYERTGYYASAVSNNVTLHIGEKVIPELLLSADNEFTYNKLITVTPSIDVTEGTITYFINGKANKTLDYNVPFTVTGLAVADNYNITAVYNQISGVNASVFINVTKAVNNIHIIINENNILPDHVTVNVTADVEGTYHVVINETYSVDVECNTTQTINLPAGLNYNATTSFSDAENYTVNIVNAIFNVKKANVTLTITGVNNNPTYEDENIINVAVSSGDINNVIYLEDNVQIGSGASLNVSKLSATNHIITVRYVEDDNYNQKEETVTINVGKKPINVNVIVNDAVYPNNLAIIIESDVNGTYTVTIDGHSAIATISNGKNASLSISGLSSANYGANIAGVSIDNGNYTISHVTSNSFTVFTQTTVDLELNTTHVSQNGFILITPGVNCGEITTGSVEIYDNNQLITTVDLSQNKNYSYCVTGVKGSLHNVSAKYLANGIYTASESENKTYNIKDTLTLSLQRVGEDLAIKSGDNVTFTFTIPDEIKSYVKLMLNNNEISLSENITFADLDDNEVYLSFDGNDYFEAVISSSVFVKVVTPIVPTVTLVLNSTDLFENGKIKVTTIVKNGEDLITVGQVTISDNVGNQKTVAAGEDVEFDVVTFDTTKNPYIMSAIYNGFTNASLIYAQSSSINYEFNHSISNIVSLSANVSEIYVGQSIEFTAICAGSEDVKLYLGNEENATFVGGKVTIQFNKSGTYVFKAVYLRGSGAYISANSTEVTITVKDKIDTTLTFDGETNVVYGNNLTLTPKVNNGKVNVGEITYYDENNVEIKTLDVSQLFTYNATNVKSYTFKAKYSGNYMYKESEATITFTVNKADNNVNIIIESGNYPDNVTVKLTATVDGAYKVDVNGTVLDVVANGVGVSHKFGVGSYQAKIIDYTSDYYNLICENKDFSVLKGTNIITVEILSSDIKYGDEVTIKVTASVAGIYTVKYGGSEIKVNVSTNGGSGINKTAKLTTVGHYYANVTWSNDNYTATINNATFDVLKAVNTIKIEVSDVNYPELVQINVTATLPGTYKVKFNNSCELDVEVNENGKGSNTIRLNAGSYSANITYNDDNYAGDITNATFKVNKCDIEIIADAINNIPIYMDINSIYANITAYNITGSIVYIENGVEIGSSEINGTFDVSGLSADEHKITVKYIGDSNYNALNKTVIINVAPKTIDVNITFSDGLSSEAIKAILESTLNGQYTVTVNGQSGLTSISNNKNATVEINGLTAGTYNTVTIDVDNTNYTVNIANKNSFTVYDAYPTSISFVLNASHVSKGGYILITPTVKDYQNNGIKEGSIEFGDGESSFTMDLSQNETYVYKITGDKGSYHTISAKYLGVENKYAESTASENKNYTIKKDLILVLERNGSNVAIISGDYVDFTITLSNESLKSDIKLFLNGEEIALSNHIQFNTLNDNVIYLSFEGNDDYDPVNSSQITVKVVNPITTHTTLTLNATELTENNKILITTKVVGDDGNEISVGNVTIYDETELITVDAGKNYNHTVSTLTTGKHNLNARYNGFADENNVYLSSESINYEYLQVYENKLTLTVDRNNIYAGEGVQFNATLKGGSGNINLYLNNDLNTTLENGVLKSILFNHAGHYTFKAVYNTDEEYASVNSSEVSINVNAKETTILTFDNAENVQFKNNISLTPSVKSGENIVNDGKIIYMENNEIIAVLDVNTIFNYTALTMGSHTITAKYNGTNRYMNSSATITFNVIKATNNVKVSVDTVYYPNAVDIVVEANIDGDYVISINSTVVSSVIVNVVDGRGNKSVILGAGNYSANITNNIENYTGELTNATFEVKKGEIELSISIPPTIVHSDNVTGTVFSNIAGNFTVKIGNLNPFNVTIHENQATFNIGMLSVDKYTAEVIFAGNSNYNPKTTSSEFNVTQNGTPFNVTVIGGYEFTYGTPITINYTLPSDAKGNITIIYAINGTEIENITVPETYTFYNLNARTYTIDVRYNGETNYPPITKQIQFTVKPAENHINVTVEGSKYPSNVTINVTADVDDDYTININGKTVIVKVKDKKGSVSVKLASGEYYANITYSNVNYVGILKNTTFKVENGTNIINVTVKSVDYPNKVDIIVNATLDGIYTIKFNDTSLDSVEVNVNDGSGIKSINLPAGSYKTIVEYVNANYTNEVTNAEFNVNKGSVELISDAINNNPTYMDVNSIYANITAYNITGGIVYIENGEEIGSSEINGTLDVSGLSAGEHKITVKYVGDSNYNVVNKTVSIKVTPKPINVNVIVSDVLSGENVDVIIESSINGTYTVTINGKSNSTTINNGINATLSISGLSTAIYDANIVGVSIDNTNYTVDVVTSNSFTVFTQTTVDLELNTTHVSQNGFILITPKVNNGEITVGSVEIYDNNQLIATVNLSENKNYSYEIKGVKGSLHNISAKYLSNSIYTASESENKTYNIKDTLTLSLERVGEELAIKSGDNVTFKFTIPDEIKSVVKLIVKGNVVSLSENITFADLGENEIYLSFDGNDYYEATKSNLIIVKVVNPIETSVRLVLNTTDLFVNGKIKVTAYVEYTGGNVTIGNVMVKDDAGNQKTLIAGHSVEFDVKTFNLGTYNMSAIYEGIATNEVIYNSSTSDNYEFYHLSTNQVILHSNTDDIYVGQSVKFTASADGNENIRLFLGDIYNSTFVDGDVTIQFNKSGTYKFKAVYVRHNGYYISANSSEVTITVKDKIDTTLTFDGETSITYGNNLTLTPKVNNGDVNVGNITYYDENGEVISTLDVSKVFSYNATSVNSFKFTARYNGNYMYKNSSADIEFTVNKANNYITVRVENVTYPNEVFINVTADLDGIYTVIIGENQYYITVKDGIGNKSVLLAPNNYEAKISYENPYYLGIITNSSFSVLSGLNNIVVIVENQTYPGEVLIKVNATLAGNYTVKLNNTQSINVEVKTANGQGLNTTKLDAGKYTATVEYANVNYTANVTSALFEVYKASNNIVVRVGEGTKYGEKAIIYLTANVTGLYKVNINGSEVIINVTNPNIEAFNNTVELTKVGIYYANVTWYNPNYDVICNNATFEVSKAVNNIKIEISGVVYPNEVVINVTADVVGVYRVYFNNTQFVDVIVDESGRGSSSIKLAAGKYSANIDYESENYTGNIINDTFEVLKGANAVVIDVIANNYPNNVTIMVNATVGGVYSVDINGTVLDVEANGTGVSYNFGAGCYAAKIINYLSDDYELVSDDKVFTVSKGSNNVEIIVENVILPDLVSIKVKADVKGIYIVNINGTLINVDVDETGEGINTTSLTAGKYYNATTTFSDNENYTVNIVNAIFNVTKGVNSIIIEIGNVVYPDLVGINVTADVVGVYRVYFNNTQFVDVIVDESGRGSSSIKLAAGKYSANIDYESENYTGNSTTDTFEVLKGEIDLKVDLNKYSYVYGQEDIRGTISSNISGKYNISIKGYYSEIITITDTSGIFNAGKSIDSGSYNVIVKFDGNENYTEKEVNKSFVVIAEGTVLNIKANGNESVCEIIYGQSVNLTHEITSGASGVINYTFENGTLIKHVNIGEYFILSNLNATTYKIIAKYGGDGDYNATEDSIVINVKKAINKIIINIDDSNYPDNVTVNVTADLAGTYRVYFNNTKYVDVDILNNNTTSSKSIKLNVGSYSANITYVADNYVGDITNATFKVHKGDVELITDAINNSPTYRDANLIYANITAYNITGSIVYIENGEEIGSSEINSTFDVSGLSTSEHKITVKYVGDGNYNAVNKTVTINVNPKHIDVNVIISDALSTEDVKVIIESSINGTYTVTIGDKSNSTTINNGRNATLSISGLSSAIYDADITIVSIDNPNYTINHVTSNVFTVFTQTTVDFELNTTHVSQNGFILITPKVNGGEITTGSVELYDDNQLIAVVNLSENNNYSYEIKGIKGSLHNVLAKYLSNGIYTASESENKTYNIKDNLTLSLERVGGELAIKSGGNVTFTLTIPDAIQSFVKLIVNNNEVPLSENVAFTDLGDNEIYLSFDGNDYYDAVNSSSVFVKVVNTITPTLRLVLNTTDLFENAKIKVTAYVGYGDSNITIGNVIVKDNVGNQKTVIAGQSVDFGVETFSLGTYQMSAVYEGIATNNLIYNSATSDDYEFYHVKENSVQLNINVDDIYVGQSVEFTASADGNEDIELFLDDIYNATFVDGDVTIQFNKSGTYKFQAVYVRHNDYYISANSSEVTINVKDKIDTTLTFDGETSITYGNNLTLTPKVNNGNVNVGEITYYDENGEVISTLDISKVFSYNATSVNSFKFTARYNGNYMYKNSSADIEFTVNKANNYITVRVENVTYPNEVFINVTADLDGIYTVIVGENQYGITVKDGIGNKSVLLAPNNYEAKISYENPYYLGIITNSSFSVLSGLNNIVVIVENQTYPDEVLIKVNATLAGNYIVKLNSTQSVNVEVKTANGQGLNTTRLNAGKYTATVEYANVNYTANVTSALFEVYKASNKIIVNVGGDVKFGKNATIVVTATIAGNYTINIDDGETLTVEIKTNGGSASNITGNFYKLGLYHANVTWSNPNYSVITQNATFEVIQGDNNIEIKVSNASYPNNVTINVTADVDGIYTVKFNNTQSVDVKVINHKGNATFSLPVGLYNATVEYNNDNYVNNANNVIFNVSMGKNNIKIIVGDVYYPDKANITVEADVDGDYTININSTSISSVKINVVNGKGNATVELASGKYSANIVNNLENYEGDITNNNFTVYKANTSFEIDSNATDSMHYGEAFKINYTVSENALGRIILSEDSKVLVNITAGGEFDNLILSAGNHVLKVEFMGNENYSYVSKDLTVNITPAVNVIELNITNTTAPNNVSIKIKTTLNGNYTLTIDKEYNITVKDNVYEGSINLQANNYIAKLHYGESNENYTSSDVVVNFKVYATSAGLNATLNSNAVAINDEVLINTSVKVDDANAEVEIIFDDGTESVKADIGEIIHYVPINVGMHKIIIKYSGDDIYPEETVNLFVNVSKRINNVIINTTSTNYPNNITINLTADVDGEYNVSIADKNVMVKANSTVSVLITPGTYTPMLTYSSDIYDVNLTNYNFTVSKAQINLLDVLTIGISDKDSNPIITFVFKNTTGNITVKINNKTYDATLVNGRANITVSNLTGGKYNATVIYSGDNLYEYAEENITVNKINNFTMNVTATSPVYGEDAVVTVELPSDASGNVTVRFGEEIFGAVVENGKATVEVSDLNYGDNSVTVSYNGDENYPIKSVNLNIHVQTNSIIAYPMTRGWDSGIDYIARVISENGSSVSGITLIFTVDGEEYEVETDFNGYASIDANLNVGTYTVSIFEPLSGTSAVSQTVIVSRIVGNKDLTMSYLENKAYTVQIIGDDGSHVGSGVKVSFEFGGKTYTTVTDSNGYARLNTITKAPGTYTVTAEYHDMEVTNKIIINTLFISKKNSKVKKSVINKKGYLFIKYNVGKYFKGKKISLKFKGKTYKAKVDGKGNVKLKISKKIINKLKVGKKYKYAMIYKLDKKNRYFKVYKSYLLFFS